MTNSPPLRRRVLLVGWDAADWNLLDPLLAAGRLPHLASLVGRGCRGRLASIRPVLSPVVWTSIATGKRPHKHGVLGFVHADPFSGAMRTAGRDLWQARAVWDILRENGWRTQVTGWFASHPAGAADGCAVSDQFAVPGPDAEVWPVPPGAVYPPEFAEPLAGLRVHPSEFDGEALQLFVPALRRGWQPGPREAELLIHLSRAVAEAASVQAAATWLMENRDWDFSAVYFRLLDECGHHFMPFRAPVAADVPAHQAAAFGGVMDGVCCFLDAMLGRLMELAGPDATVMVLSDHGFQSARQRPAGRADRPEDMAMWHRQFGMVALRGPGLLQGATLYGSSILDAAPTLLHLCGLAVGRDMDGKVWRNALTDPGEVVRCDTWERTAGESGSPAPASNAPVEAAMIEHLADLGYLDSAPPDEAASRTAAEWEFNRITALIDAGILEQARDAARALHEAHPDEPRYHQLYSEGLARLGDFAAAGAEAAAFTVRHGPCVWSHLITATVLTETGDPSGAQREIAAAAVLAPGSAALHDHAARLHLRQRQWARAERAFRASLAIEPENPHACAGLARALVRQDKLDEALEWALTGVGLQHLFPIGHFQLGAILSRRGEELAAITAFEVCLSQAPAHRMAHRYLSILHARAGAHDKAMLHRMAAEHFSRSRA